MTIANGLRRYRALTHVFPEKSASPAGRFLVTLTWTYGKCYIFHSYPMNTLYYGDNPLKLLSLFREGLQGLVPLLVLRRGAYASSVGWVGGRGGSFYERTLLR